jgi:hypothetical protein
MVVALKEGFVFGGSGLIRVRPQPPKTNPSYKATTTKDKPLLQGHCLKRQTTLIRPLPPKANPSYKVITTKDKPLL